MKSIRRIVLESKKEMENVKKMIYEIIKNWEMEGDVQQVDASSWLINKTYVLKSYTKEESLKRNISILKILYEEKIPVPKIIPLKNGDLYFNRNGHQYILTTQLEGKNSIDLNKCSEKWLYDFGGIIGDLHLAFGKIQNNISYWNNSMIEEMEGWVSQNLLNYEVTYLNKDHARKAIVELREVYSQLPKQLIHRNIHLGNFLFNDHGFSAYMNFDLSQSNIRIFDVCYFLLGLLSEGNNTRISKDHWFVILKHVVKGYDSKLPLSPVEINAIPCVMKNIELLFVAYFLGQEDEILAEDAGKLFNFVSQNENLIIKTLLNN